jgi:hypothetical protein
MVFVYYEKHPEAWRRAETHRTAWEYREKPQYFYG